MARQSIKERLAAAKKLYAKTEAMLGSEPLPPGVGYTGVIGSSTIAVSKNDNMGVTVPITVTSPEEFKGRAHRTWSNLETDTGIGFFKGDLEKIEIGIPDDIGDIGDALDEMEGVEIRFDVVKVDEYLNTYFRERVSGGKSKASDEADKPEDEPEYTKRELTKLGKQADDEDDDAISELEAAAKASKLDPDGYLLWAELADAIIEDLGL